VLESDDGLLADALGEDAVVAVWDDPAVDWSAFDLVVIRSTWDYTPRRDEFLAWADALGERLHNPPAVVRWNSDKRYLADLEAAGLPVVPTTFVEPGSAVVLPDGPCVVKPAVSAGSQNTARHDDPAAAREHAQRLLDDGRVVMVQPYIASVDTAGETALLYYDGRFDHAIRKGPMLLGGAAAVTGLFAAETIEPREPQAEELALADAVVAEVTRRFGRPLYARVDLLGGADPIVLELELIEPSLFFGQSEGAAARYAAAIRARGARAPAAGATTSSP
jgi:glutathione synthase/RimK-type ligase-like ATP-grasp enzyme